MGDAEDRKEVHHSPEEAYLEKEQTEEVMSDRVI